MNNQWLMDGMTIKYAVVVKFFFIVIIIFIPHITIKQSSIHNFQNHNIYLLDDILSAVDPHVANHIYSKCINGMLKNKTRLLCTHQSKYLVQADWVIVMRDGKIANQGNFKCFLCLLYIIIFYLTNNFCTHYLDKIISWFLQKILLK